VATGIHPERGFGYRLVGFQVESFVNLTDEEGVPEWDSERSRTLPARVLVTLTYEDGNENLLPFSREVVFRLMGAQLPGQAGGGNPFGGGGANPFGGGGANPFGGGG
jgi:hypothetical protein